MEGGQLHIGEFDNKPFHISGSNFITGRTAIVGMSGAGKSYLIGVICEELCEADLPFVIIDPEGEYKFLKQKYEVVWACNHSDADVQLNVQCCQMLAQIAVMKEFKLILDTSESSNEFGIVREFLKYFFMFEGKLRNPMLVIVEEVDRFAPQKRGDSVDELLEISRGSRKSGLGLMISTQRPAMVDKNVLSQCDSQFIGRLRTENDLNAVSLFFKSRDLLNTVNNLGTGQFYAMGEISPTVQKIHTRARNSVYGRGTPHNSKKPLDIYEKEISGGNNHPSEKQPPRTVSFPNRAVNKMIIEHFIWYPVRGRGYQEMPMATSGDLNHGIFTNVFNREYAPLMISYSDTDYRGYMLFNKPSMSHIIYSYIYHRAVDEFGRRGVFHHGAIIKKSALAEGIITLLDVERAMNLFDDEHPMPKGDIAPLDVAVREKPGFEYLGMIHKYISKAAAETLATRMLSSSESKTSFRCLGADKEKRKMIAIYLTELLTFKCGIPVSFCTERPITDESYSFFNLAVTERAIAPYANAENWCVINWDMPDPGIGRLDGNKRIYEIIDAAFHN